jgi:hypothetical protein
MTLRVQAAAVLASGFLACTTVARAADLCAQAGEAVADEVTRQCDCCARVNRCIRGVVKAAVVVGTLPTECRRQARRDSHLACRAVRRAGCLHWFPACNGPWQCGQAIYPAPPCGQSEILGARCAKLGVRCNPPDESCSQLGCLPARPVLCPISRRAAKRDIRYLNDADLNALRADVLAMKLARYRHRTDGAGGPERLGFLIDDAPHTPAVAPDATQVDLYGYASMVVAAVQTQAKEIEELRREISALRRTSAPRAPRE